MIWISILLAVQSPVNGVPADNDCFAEVKTAAELRLAPEDIAAARVIFDPSSNQPALLLTLTDEANARFIDLQKGQIGETIGVYFKDKLLVQPRLNEYIHGGKIQITGDFTVEEVNQLQLELMQGKPGFK